MNIDTMIERPHCLKVILHALFELLRNLVKGQEVLEISPLGLVH